MNSKILIMFVILEGCFGSRWFTSSYAGGGTTPSPEAAKNNGPVLVMT